MHTGTRALVVLLAVVGALLSSLAAGALLYQRHRALEDIALQAQSGATFAAAYTGRTYEIAAQSLRLADQYVRENGTSDPNLARYLAGITQDTSLTDYIIVVGPAGELLASSLPDKRLTANFGDRTWFRETKLRGGLVVGPVVRSRLSDDVVWTLSRPLDASPGDFRGAVAVGVQAVGVLPVTARRPEDPLATVWTSAGQMLAGNFVDFAPTGEAIQAPPPFALDPRRAQSRETGAVIAASAPVAGWPLITVVSYDREGVLARWRLEVLWTTLLLAFGLVITGFLVARSIRSEHRERNTSAELGLVLESVADAFYALDRDWRFLVFNAAAERYFGKSRSDVIGRFFLEVIPAAEGTELEARFKRVMETGRAERFRFNSTAAPGRTADVRATRRQDGGLTVTFTDITEEARAAVARAKSEAMLRSIADAMPVLISYVDSAETFQFANKAYEDRFGRRLEEIVGRSLAEVFGPEVYEARHPYIQRALAGERVRYEIGFPKPEGPRLTVVEHLPHFGDRGEVLGFYALVQDITELRRTEAELRASEQRLAVATEASKIGVWEWLISTGEIILSERARRIWGFPLEGAITFDDLAKVIHPEDRALVTAQARRAMDPALREDQPYNYRINAPNGVRMVRAMATAIFEAGPEGDRAVRYIGTMEDITDAHAVRADLERSEARLRLAIDAGRMAVWAIDATGELVVTPELNRMVGLPDDARPTLAELQAQYYPGELERLQTFGAEVTARKDKFLETEYRHIRVSDGSVRWFLVRAEMLSAPDGAPAGTIGVVLDITDRKEDEERLQLLAREVDHRANNLLSVVQAAISLTRGETVGKFKEALLGRVEALGRAHQLLAASRWHGASLRTLLEEELKPYQSPDGQRVVSLGVDVALAPATAQAVAMVVHELATNAAKHGALSVLGGSVQLSWTRIEDSSDWELVWQERDGPVVTVPSRRGVGMQVVERALRGASGGSADIEWLPEGLVCRIRFRAA